MKCPKCGYLGFETTERCRHCGYDFSLSVAVDPPSELPLRALNEQESPLADFDLDRVIGEPEPPRPEAAVAIRPPRRGEVQRRHQPDRHGDSAPLPLFTRSPAEPGDAPLVAPPPPARPPLAVRRATPEVARRRTPRTFRREHDGLELQLQPAAASRLREADADEAAATSDAVGSPTARRVGAAVFDLILLGSISAAVLYLTLAIAGLSLVDFMILPPIPMAGFLLLLNGGYLVAFTAANGQTIGKMLFGIRVIGDDHGRVAVKGAVLRSAGILLAIVTLGLPYLPVFVSRDGRALHDRLAGTRVIKHA
jgi:uncharacterized RDD family membrane protein YckC